jgi:molybdate transport system ATP-binding protein
MLKAILKRSLPGFKLDVEIYANHDLVAVMGPSGSGKTMSLQCLAGLCRPDEGYIELNNRVLFDSKKGINLPPGRRKVGFVFQNYALFPHLNVEDNIAYGIRHLPRTEVREKVKGLLDLLHLDQLANRLPRQLSAGQQQRVAIARALAPGPEVLLLDEPFSALDTQLRERLELELLSLHAGFHGSMLLVTHDLVEGFKLGSKMAIFQGGKIIQSGSRDRVFNEPINRTVARVTGVRNQMEGEIKRVENGYAWVYIPAWNTEIKVILRRVNYMPGERVTAGIRPEYIEHAQGPGENIFPATILQVVESIASVSYRFLLMADTAGKHYLNATISKCETSCMRVGETCLLRLPPDEMILIGE